MLNNLNNQYILIIIDNEIELVKCLLDFPPFLWGKGNFTQIVPSGGIMAKLKEKGQN